MEHKKSFVRGAILGALVTLLVTVIGIGTFKIATNLGMLDGIFGPVSLQRETDKKLRNLRTWIDEEYLYTDKIDEKALQDGIYTGYVSGLGDPYTAYYNKAQAKELLESTVGEFFGIGAAIERNYQTGIVSIGNVYKDSPAEESGLQEGDILLQVDDNVVEKQDLSEVVSWVKGEEGTEVTLQVSRGPEMEKVICKATRRKIEVNTVEYEMKEEKIGYIKITEFDQVTYKQFKSAFDELQGQGMNGLVVDLRANPGGDLGTVIDTLKLLLPKDLIVYTQDKYGKKKEYTNDQDNKFAKPMTVLVNENSASAAEIFAGAIQDYKVGKIVGATTYGKGIVQQLVNLGDDSYLKVTISEYFLPSGRSIHGKGVVPDIEVKNEADSDVDYQLNKALETVSGK